MTEAKILTKHPQGKSGKSISKDTYELFKEAILATLGEQALTHAELFQKLNTSMEGKFSGNVGWYAETVKLDLEARKILERTDDRPQKYRVKKSVRRSRVANGART